MSKSTTGWNGLALSVLALVSGCGAQSSPPTTADRPAASQAGEKYLLASEPADAQSILQVREESQDGDAVVLVGRIGGDVNPWVEGRAAFSLVDLSAQACNDIPGDNCPTPWDYCCETDKLVKGRTLIKVVDAEGKPLATDARELLGVKELDTLVVRGKAQKDAAGNLTILASHVFVRPPSAGSKTDEAGHDHAHHGEEAHGHDHDHAAEDEQLPPPAKPADESGDSVPSPPAVPPAGL